MIEPYGGELLTARRARRPLLSLLVLMAMVTGCQSSHDPLAHLSNRDVAENFLKIALTPEFTLTGSGRNAIIKYEGPVRVAIAGTVSRQLADSIERQVSQLKAITGHDIALDERVLLPVFGKADAAVARAYLASRSINLVVFSWEGSWANFAETNEAVLLALHWDKSSLELATRRREARQPQCVNFVSHAQHVIRRAYAVVRHGFGDTELQRCVVEEISQSLGLGNDSVEVVYSVFNDASKFINLTEQDRLFLKILYDRRFVPGTPRDESYRLAVEVLDELRPGR